MYLVVNTRTKATKIMDRGAILRRLEERAATGEFSPWGEETIEAFMCSLDEGRATLGEVEFYAIEERG